MSIGLPVLRHLCVDKKTLLEERRDLLDKSDCSKAIFGDGKGPRGTVSRIMVAQLYGVTNKFATVNKPIEAIEADPNQMKVKHSFNTTAFTRKNPS